MAKAKTRVRLVVDVEHPEDDFSVMNAIERMLILYNSAPAPNAGRVALYGKALVISSRIQK